jgi:hypothetical protein
MPATAAQPAAWITRSNEHAQVVLDQIARFHPELGRQACSASRAPTTA